MYRGFSRTCLSAAFRFRTAASAGPQALFIIRGSSSNSHKKNLLDMSLVVNDKHYK